MQARIVCIIRIWQAGLTSYVAAISYHSKPIDTRTYRRIRSTQINLVQPQQSRLLERILIAVRVDIFICSLFIYLSIYLRLLA